MKFILRLFPEISIKSRPVRNRLIKVLTQNLFNVALNHHFAIKVQAQWDKILVTVGEDDSDATRELAVRELSRVPGIHSFLEVKEFEFERFDDIFAVAGPIYGPSLEGKTFAVRVRRRGNHPFTSQEAERMIGGMFKALYPNLGVNLGHPDVTINIEIDQGKAFVITDKHQGMGGYPVGSQGAALSLISGGFDSGVSTYKAIHRGMRVSYLFFNMGGTAHELGVKQESYFIWDRYASSHRVKFVTIPFERIVGQILERTHHGVRGVILKRMMMRVGSKIAERLNCEALITGESVGQVSSQTVTNLNHIDSVSDCLVLRPLVMEDKQDIVDAAKAIGTAGFAESMPEYCGVISDHPNVCPKRSFVEEEEAKMDPDLVADAVAKAVVLDIKDIPEDTNKLQVEVETVNTLAHNDVVLDVRAPDDAEKSPLKVEGHEVITLPFYKVSSEFGKLDNLKTYALYCDQGVMSLMQARELKEKGYHNLKVYRP
ncbi:MAG TPA: tRNA 4-thiouridine(8) synthase ThiI [Candidatus Anaerobiospirillum pullistercoris]|uniref:tRNA sulfurtransferase n=1 Tax=Candidatus Anaerobiospirillum pullistercoris TaxID=2838452 RepID=A0A9D2B256_9GAMM|nr:tRNA 4-thiouridine(8) synthase ThiI [Candidatus Anaerobiospirillum pullistercoris]